ncbi:MAG TPA: ABC transporter permease subunit [Solirubrobacterales bacterium]
MEAARVTATAATAPRDSVGSWPWRDRLGYFAAWGTGLALIAIAAAIVIYMAWRGAQYFDLGLLFESPNATLNQAQSGGFKDPIIGTALLLTISTLIAAPLGVAIAVWLTEYGRPTGLARAVESAVEVVAGTPSIVLAMFGLVFFQQQWLGFLTFDAEGGAVLGRSFIAASSMMALIALPLVVGATREALNAIPGHVREASYALGKTKAATIRRVLLPAARPGIGTGAALGMGRVAGDTAIVVVLLGATLQIQNGAGGSVFGLFRGTGSTLTSYVYYNSPAGEGLSPEKAYFAAFVLLLLVIFLNFVVTRLARGRGERWTR